MENYIADSKKGEFCNKSTSHVIIDILQCPSQKMVSWLKEDQLLVISFIEVNSSWSLEDKGNFQRKSQEPPMSLISYPDKMMI